VAGWRLVNPLDVSRTLDEYADYIAGSKGELSVAKHGYVVARSGWFSERTACYLASGRPAVVEDTGFSRFLPCGEGLFAFTTPDEARSCLAAATGRYARHCAAAREVARECFASDRVLASLVARAVEPAVAAGPEGEARA
jgi:hypothetical protein